MALRTAARLTHLAVGLTGALALAACSTGPVGGDATGTAGQTEGSTAATGTTDGATTDGSGTTGAAAAGEDTGSFPVTVEHAFGETTIEADPQRVVTIGWTDHEVMAALGEVPVGPSRSPGAATRRGRPTGSTRR